MILPEMATKRENAAPYAWLLTIAAFGLRHPKRSYLASGAYLK
jgi:hypothetical protein